MKCVLCSNSHYEALFSGESWKVKRCTKCGLVSTDRKTVDMDYQFYHRDDDYKKLESHFRNIFQKRVNIVKKYKSDKGIVLDIGCSNGTMLDIFQKEGWETWGVEPSENAEYAIDKGHKVLQSTFEKVKITPDYFDVIILNHTLEHLDNPLEVLTKINTLLKKGGIVLVDVPNFGSLLSELSREHWIYLLPNEHNFQFTKDSLGKIFEKANLNVIYFESRSGIFEFDDPIFELKQSLFGMKKRFITSILSLPYSLIATLLNRGDSMSMVGRK